jgi:hypothetical protein
MNLREIESLDNDAMNGRVAGLVSRYWHRQGYTVEVGRNEGPVWSNLRYGLPPGYCGDDAIRLAQSPYARAVPEFVPQLGGMRQD